MIFRLAFRNVISKKSSYVIILFMSFAVALFCIANAVIDSTENGVQTTFISSFTGDVVIRSNTKGQMSLFGDETPVTGSLTKLECVVPYTEVNKFVSNLDVVNGTASQVTGSAALEVNGQRYAVFLFGVNPQQYLPLMKSVKLIEGKAFGPGEKCAMVSRFIADKFDISVGDEIQFTVADGPYFRIRKVNISGIYDYETNNAIFERYVLIDPDTLRSLMDIQDTVTTDVEIDEEKSFLLDDDLDFDSLFDDVEDTSAEFEEIDDFEVFADVAEALAEIHTETEFQESTTWNYIICKLTDKAKPKKVIRRLNRQFKKNGWPVIAMDWRHSAGSTALYLYWLRLILNVGIAIVLTAGFIIVNNTLTVNVLDRTREIGTLRAIGAKKRFISGQCMAETFMMTLTSGVIGTLLGVLMAFIITKMHIQFGNSYLIQLFGADALRVYVTWFNVLKLFILVVVLGIIGWIYPVITALKVNPVRAMQGAK